MDHYETLEVSRNASPEVIRAAYKSLMQRLHPDKCPEGEAGAGRAAQIAAAYAVLSSPERRAAYDLALRRDGGPGAPAAGGSHPAAGRGDRPAVPSRAHRHGDGGKVAKAGGARAAVLVPRFGLWGLAVVLAVGAVWALAQWSARSADPRTELAAIRQAFASADVTEEQRRALFARKLDLLAQQPALRPAEHADKADEMAARTFALLASPLVVRLGGAAPGGMALTIERISLLVGTFDAQRHLAHLAGHRERLVGVLSERLEHVDAARLAGPQAESSLKKVLLDAIVATLGTDPAQTYPSTYFESPGRYGVVDLVLPAQFSLLPLSALPE